MNSWSQGGENPDLRKKTQKTKRKSASSWFHSSEPIFGSSIRSSTSDFLSALKTPPIVPVEEQPADAEEEPIVVAPVGKRKHRKLQMSMSNLFSLPGSFGRMFSELPVSETPSIVTPRGITDDFEINMDRLPQLSFGPDDSFEIGDDRSDIVLKMKAASVKKAVVYDGRISNHSVIVGEDTFLLPRETIRHCRTGRIKRGCFLVKKMGGMYVVDKERDLIALKVMEKEVVQECYQMDDEDVKFELAAMTELNETGGHENVLKLFDVFETQEHIIAAMELVDGDLHDMLPSIRSNPICALDIFYQILKGYSFVIDNGFYHCDLSLENILIKLIPNYKASRRTRWIAKLADFGQAKRIKAVGQNFVDANSVAGKPYYLAPEAYMGSYEIGPAEVWSLGVIWYILLTGSAPFEIANDSDAMFEAFLNEGSGVLEVTLKENDVNASQCELVLQMLSLNPRLRPSVFELVEHDIFKSLIGEDIAKLSPKVTAQTCDMDVDEIDIEEEAEPEESPQLSESEEEFL